jgi:hypothetical protein
MTMDELIALTAPGKRYGIHYHSGNFQRI